jgi:putative Mn2+ efflux pump MntP
MTLLLLALAVAADAAAVCAALALRGLPIGRLAGLAAVFGAFQVVMPLLGALGGMEVTRRLAPWDDWLAFAILVAVGGRMIHEALAADRDAGPPRLGVGAVLGLGVATSVDSLAVGVTLPALELPIVRSALVIGAVTAGLSLAVARLARRVGERFGVQVEVLGGLVLVALGVATLARHLGWV